LAGRCGFSDEGGAVVTDVHWGTFHLDTPHWNALKFIDPLMRQNRPIPYELFDPGDDNDFQIIGRPRDTDLIVTVVCVPVAEHRTWVSVIACGPDGHAAELERNSLRQKIIDLRLN
jgi:hypothetical protein